MKKKILGTTVALTLLAIFGSSVEAAIRILRATIAHGQIEVAGFHAPRLQAISWQGVSQGIKSNRFGVFAFATADLPEGCVGRLKIGYEERDVVIKDCTPTPEATAGVLKTGQTACYDTFGKIVTCTGTGQDGELQKGMARSYIDNGDGTITDNSTGLVWEKLTDDATIHNVNDLYTWLEAFAKIAALNTTPCFAGHCDWRLPNVNELQTLADYGRVSPAIAPEFNNGVDSFTQSFIYWSSTTSQGNPGDAWFVFFFDGRVSPDEKGISYHVRAVRGGS